MKLFAALWYLTGCCEFGEIARWFYEDGTLIHIFEDHIEIKRCKIDVLHDLVRAHLDNGWSQLPT